MTASMASAPCLTSVFLVKLSNLVKSISLLPKRSMGQQLPETAFCTSQLRESPSDVSDPFPCPEDPPCESSPQIPFEKHRSELDELLEETEREIKALMEFWENCFVGEKEDSSREIPWISKWHLGDPLDFNEECLREDPSYDEERVEQEALQDYLKEPEDQRAHVAVEQAASQKRDPATSSGVEDKFPALVGKVTICANASASLSQRRPSTRKKPCVILSVAGEAEATRKEPWGESGSPSSSSEEEEAAVFLWKTPKRNLRCRASGMGKTHTGNPPDRSEQLQRCKQKVFGHHRCNHQAPVTDQSCEKSETPSSSSWEGQPLKPYNFCPQSKLVSYALREEEEDSCSEGSSKKDWVPEVEVFDTEEEQDTEEMEEEENDESEREDESETDARPPQGQDLTCDFHRSLHGVVFVCSRGSITGALCSVNRTLSGLNVQPQNPLHWSLKAWQTGLGTQQPMLEIRNSLLVLPKR